MIVKVANFFIGKLPAWLQPTMRTVIYHLSKFQFKKLIKAVLTQLSATMALMLKPLMLDPKRWYRKWVNRAEVALLRLFGKGLWENHQCVCKSGLGALADPEIMYVSDYKKMGLKPRLCKPWKFDWVHFSNPFNCNTEPQYFPSKMGYTEAELKELGWKDPCPCVKKSWNGSCLKHACNERKGLGVQYQWVLSEQKGKKSLFKNTQRDWTKDFTHIMTVKDRKKAKKGQKYEERLCEFEFKYTNQYCRKANLPTTAEEKAHVAARKAAKDGYLAEERAWLQRAKKNGDIHAEELFIRSDKVTDPKEVNMAGKVVKDYDWGIDEGTKKDLRLLDRPYGLNFQHSGVMKDGTYYANGGRYRKDTYKGIGEGAFLTASFEDGNRGNAKLWTKDMQCHPNAVSCKSDSTNTPVARPMTSKITYDCNKHGTCTHKTQCAVIFSVMDAWMRGYSSMVGTYYWLLNGKRCSLGPGKSAANKAAAKKNLGEGRGFGGHGGGLASMGSFAMAGGAW